MTTATITLFKNKKEAEAVVGTLSKPSKMPGHAYSIPASKCRTGGLLRDVIGSVCENCYACKGRYRFDNVQQAMERRFSSISSPNWVDGMVYLIQGTGDNYFRWHDSGDIQSVEHLAKICEIAKKMSEVHFWLPTKEKGLVNQYLRANGAFPENLTVRISAPLIDMVVTSELPTSSVHKNKPALGHECPAPKQGNQCGNCRACWDRAVKNISYHNH